VEPSPLILSLFPGIGLLDMAFEKEGFTVVRGPDLLWGGDIRTFHVPAGRFDGVIGGPPCKPFSTANNIGGTEQTDLIPDFLRVVHEAAPSWVVMENVTGAIGHPCIPTDWFPCILRDWDCGGNTSRTRAFWTWPFALMQPCKCPGEPSPVVLASTWKQPGPNGKTAHMHKGFLRGDLPMMEYARLQGAEEIGRRLEQHRAGKAFSVTVLGNGVPLAMGRYIAQGVKRALPGVTPPEAIEHGSRADTAATLCCRETIASG
jgi:DNA (cytosine-5)-methyltransferase 1